VDPEPANAEVAAMEVTVSNPLLEEMAKAYPLGKRWARRDEYAGFDLRRHGDLWFTAAGQVVVPTSELRLQVVREHHDTPLAGHFGRTKTLEAVSRGYWWPGMRKDVQQYVRECQSCQEAKASNQAPGGLLQPLPVPDAPWDVVHVDFVMGLPKSREGFDAVMMVIDRLTKMAHFIPTTTTVTAVKAAELYIANVVRLHGLPGRLVSDRDPRFTGNFWQAVHENLLTSLSMSSAYHPQTNGQVERINRVLEDALRHFVAADQTDWDAYLPLVEFAYNNARQESAGQSPFFLNYGYHPRGPGSVRSRVNPDAASWLDRREQALAEAKRCLEAAQQRQKAWYDRSRRRVEYEPGELVMLTTEHMRVKDSSVSRKLMPRWIGPFAVAAKVGEAAVRLDLPPGFKIHPVVHVSWLKSHKGQAAAAPPPGYLESGDPEFTVERILDHEDRKKGRRVVRYYLVKWGGYTSSENTWEPATQLDNCAETVTAYERSLALRQRPKARAAVRGRRSRGGGM
jgi:hypothetical protein